MRLHERLERRKQLLAEREREKPTKRSKRSDPASARRGSGGLDLSGFEGVAQVFPPAAVLFIVALPIILLASVLRRR